MQTTRKLARSQSFAPATLDFQFKSQILSANPTTCALPGAPAPRVASATQPEKSYNSRYPAPSHSMCRPTVVVQASRLLEAFSMFQQARRLHHKKSQPLRGEGWGGLGRGGLNLIPFYQLEKLRAPPSAGAGPSALNPKSYKPADAFFLLPPTPWGGLGRGAEPDSVLPTRKVTRFPQRGRWPQRAQPEKLEHR